MGQFWGVATRCGGKDGPTISHTSGRRLELQLGGHRRPSRGWSPTSRNLLAGVWGPLDRLGVDTRVRKDGPAQRSLSPTPQEGFPSKTSSRQTVPSARARCSEKGASSRKRASTLRHHARVGLGRGTSQLRACGDREPVTSIRSSGPVEGVQEQGQHGRAFGLRVCPRREKTFPGSPWGRGNTRRGQPGRLGEFPVGYTRGTIPTQVAPG